MSNNIYIALYISSHGFGHMTRCLAVVDYILKNSNYNIYIACDKNQNDFARIYLKDYSSRIIYKDILTDIGLINKKNSLEVDSSLLEEQLSSFINSWDDTLMKEYNMLKSLEIKCIISDISPIGCLLGHKLGVENILISNFTWVDQYKFLNINENIISKFRLAYSYVTKFIKYDLALPTSSIITKNIDEVSFICRPIYKERVEFIRKKYGKSIFITCGKSATLNKICIKNFRGTIFTTSGVDIICDDKCNVIKLPIDILDTQNYIAACDLVIAKAGWGTIAEAIVAHTNLVLIERPSAKEDSFNIEEIKKNKLGISIKEEDLFNLDIEQIENQLKESIDYKRLNTYKNDVKCVVNIILNADKNKK